MTRARVDPSPRLTMPCSKCGLVKPEDGFHPSAWGKNHRRGLCKACCSKIRAREYHHEGVKERMETKRQRRMAVVNAIKADKGCRDCNEHDPVCLDFHHRDPNEKRKGIGALVARCTAIPKLLEEIDKCDVVCANCHRKYHAKHGRPSRWNKPKIERVEALTLRLA